ncbi:YVTN family beta-propeller repeat protein [Burkholderia plantarii]|uniref:YVTN family beta-propeller repeat protein n=1 Tax=Burkholderia plantarii TaxID=41899 RepID=UPI0018DDB25E|nr:beta-propeller fold lactonase family protein [Burkholderia plantarii]MBI0331528.1 beta-propeller fold lactonase family protein [Burkholderia plantarii]
MFRSPAARLRVLLLSLACAAGAPLAARADNVIVLDSAEAKLNLIDEASRKVVATLPAGKEPHHLMITPDGHTLLVANSVSDNLMFVDPPTGRVTGTLQDIEDPYQLGFSPDGKWFVTNALRLDRVDIYHYGAPLHFTLAKRLPLAKMPSHMTFSIDNRTVYVSLQESGEVAAIDLPTQTVAWRAQVGRDPAGLWMTPDNRHLLVGMTGEDDVAVLDCVTHQVVKRIHTGRGAHNFRSLDDGRHVAVTNRVDSTISVLDYTTLTNTGDITGLMPGPDDMELSADKRFLWVTFRFSRHVGVIDLGTRKLVTTIAVGRSPHGIFFADRAPVYAPNPD